MTYTSKAYNTSSKPGHKNDQQKNNAGAGTGTKKKKTAKKMKGY